MRKFGIGLSMREFGTSPRMTKHLPNPKKRAPCSSIICWALRTAIVEASSFEPHRSARTSLWVFSSPSISLLTIAQTRNCPPSSMGVVAMWSLCRSLLQSACLQLLVLYHHRQIVFLRMTSRLLSCIEIFKILAQKKPATNERAFKNSYNDFSYPRTSAVYVIWMGASTCEVL